jgi:cobyrinic acid a,c-diamide synthase
MSVGFLLAGTASGVGKTTVTLGLLRALKRRGLKVAPFKAGPDYIDPGLHRLAAGRPSRNLDTWMMPPEHLAASMAAGARGADVVLVEGVMGLFDGAGATGATGATENEAVSGPDSGSSADLAVRLGLPVILVVDAARMAGSVAALVHGFATLHDTVRVAGVILNRVASDNHLNHLTESISRHTQVPVLGHLRRDGALSIAERHLGLITADDLLDRAALDRMADAVEAGVDLDALLKAAGPVGPFLEPSPWPTPKVRIGIARDATFCFVYPQSLEALAAAGAEIVPFSPLTEIELPEDLDGLYLPGGYPELAAAALSANRPMRDAIKKAADGGLPIVAECGGLIYLSEGIRTVDGRFHDLCGVLPAPCEMHPKRVALGYRQLTLTENGPFGPSGTVLRGHEFRYSEIDRTALDTLSQPLMVSDRRGRPCATDGYRVGNVWASYAHLVVTEEVAVHWVNYLMQKRV